MDVTGTPGPEQLRLFGQAMPSEMPEWEWVWLVVADWWSAVKGELSLSDWRPLLVEAVRARFAANEETAALAVGNVGRLFGFLEAHGVRGCNDLTTALVLKWCWAPRPDANGLPREVSQTTARHRQWSALACLQEAAALGCPVDPAALIGERIPRPPASVSVRPLDEHEDHLACRHADTGLLGSQRSLIVALSRAGGSARELASVRVRDIDLEAATVTFRGDAARTNHMDEWSTQAAARWWRCLSETPDPGELACVSKGMTVARCARSIGVRLGDVLAETEIRHRPGVSAGSFRLTGARRVLEASTIEAAARFMGAVSLDRAAEALRHNWREHHA